MFKNLNNLFSGNSSQKAEEPDLKIATAVLFLEMAAADFEVLDEEKDKIHQILNNFFATTDQETNRLVDEAQKVRAARNDIWYFTNSIKQNFSREQKKIILEKLWTLIYADGRIDKYEDMLIRKVTNLLGLEHSDMIAAKLKAKNGE